MMEIDELLHKAFVWIDFPNQSHGLQSISHQQASLLHQEGDNNCGRSWYSKQAVNVNDASAFNGIFDKVCRRLEERRKIEGGIIVCGNSIIFDPIVLIGVVFARTIDCAKHIVLCHINYVSNLELFEFRHIGSHGGVSEEQTREYFMMCAISITTKSTYRSADPIQFTYIYGPFFCRSSLHSSFFSVSR